MLEGGISKTIYEEILEVKYLVKVRMESQFCKTIYNISRSCQPDHKKTGQEFLTRFISVTMSDVYSLTSFGANSIAAMRL